MPFLYPLTHRGWERPYVGAGVALYDAMAMVGRYDRGLPRHRHLSPAAGAAGSLPICGPDALVGAIRYYDAQVDDARHTMTVVRTAAAYGAHVANRAPGDRLPREGERVTGVRVRRPRDRPRARGPGPAGGQRRRRVDRRHPGAGRRRGAAPRPGVSKGIHLVVPRDRIRSETGLIMRTETSVLFVIPWGRHWIIGTTDTDWDLDKAHPAASRTDIDYLLGHVNTRARGRRCTREDVEGVYAGLRPLLSGESEPTAKLSREHTVVAPVPGLVMVAGGKYTTYRVMAKRRRGRRRATRSAARVPDSVTDGVPLARRGRLRGAAERAAATLATARACTWPGSTTCSAGTAVSSTSCWPWSPSGPTSAGPLEGADDYLRAEVVYAVTHEGARHLDDVLTRRTRISIETFDRGVTAAPAGRRADGRRAGLGPRAVATTRSTTTCAGWRRSGRASGS